MILDCLKLPLIQAKDAIASGREFRQSSAVAFSVDQKTSARTPMLSRDAASGGWRDLPTQHAFRRLFPFCRPLFFNGLHPKRETRLNHWQAVEKALRPLASSLTSPRAEKMKE